MALAQIRNPEVAHSRTVIAKVALKVGMVVKMVQGTAKGEPTQVDLCLDADLADATVIKGVVMFVQDNDLAVDFILVPGTSQLTLNTASDNTTDIPAGSLCTFWYNKPVIGLHSAAADPLLVFANVREGDKVAVNTATGKIAPLVATGVDANRDIYLGTVFQHEGAELSILLNSL